MGRLDGKVAIVTGAARGSGELTARRLVGEGACVVLADVLDDRGKPVADELGARARYLHLDITDEAEWEAALRFTLGEFGGLSTLVNNAAVLHIGPIEHTPVDEVLRVLNVNAVGTFLGVRTAIAPMRDGGGGSIINVSSISGHHPAPGTAAYAISKFGVRGLTKVAALELGRYGIRVNSVNPAMGNPEMVLESLGVVPGSEATRAEAPKASAFGGRNILRRGEMGDVADAVVFLASDESSFFTGADFDLDGGITAGTQLPGGIPGAPKS